MNQNETNIEQGLINDNVEARLNFATQIFNTKTITSAGGIVLAIMMSYFLYKITGNHLDHIDKSIDKQIEVTQETNDILRNLNGTIQSNTEVLRALNQRIK